MKLKNILREVVGNNEIISNCHIALEKIKDNGLMLFRGDRSIDNYTYRVPRNRKSVTGYNIANLLFDFNPYNIDSGCQKRSKSIIFTNKQEVANFFGSKCIVTPIENPLISYAENDFIETKIMEGYNYSINDFEVSFINICEQCGVHTRSYDTIDEIKESIEKLQYDFKSTSTHKYKNHILYKVLKSHETDLLDFIFKSFSAKKLGIITKKLSDLYESDNIFEGWTEFPVWITPFRKFIKDFNIKNVDDISYTHEYH